LAGSVAFGRSAADDGLDVHIAVGLLLKEHAHTSLHRTPAIFFQSYSNPFSGAVTASVLLGLSTTRIVTAQYCGAKPGLRYPLSPLNMSLVLIIDLLATVCAH